jgi:hypothetical protein
MEPDRFDQLATRFGQPQTRRTALRLLGLALLGGSGRLAAKEGEAKGAAHPHGHPTQRHQAHLRRGHKGVSGQIAGGTPVPPGKYSFAVSLFADFGAGAGGRCSGSLIDPSHVLTAAHCTVNPATGAPVPPSAYRVVVGQVDRTAQSCAGCRKQVTAVAVDPAWTGAGLETIRPHDVAVLTLDSPVDASLAQPIALVGSGGDGLDGAGQNVIAAGWGLTTTHGSPSTMLMEAPLSVLSDAACVADPAQLCTGVVSGRATCSGDSGGPLFVAVSSATTGADRAARAGHALRPQASLARRHHHHHGGTCPTPCPGGCAPELNAVCCPPSAANPAGGYCHAGATCCPPSADFPLGGCAPAGVACDGGGGGGGTCTPACAPDQTCQNGTCVGGGGGASRFVQIGVVSGGPEGCPSTISGAYDVYTRLSNSAINGFIRTAAPTTSRAAAARAAQHGQGHGHPAKHRKDHGRTDAGRSKRAGH